MPRRDGVSSGSGKLDPRLQFLADLHSDGRLARVHDGELQRLRALAEEIRSTQRQLHEELGAVAGNRERIRTLETSLVGARRRRMAPITAGFHGPEAECEPAARRVLSRSGFRPGAFFSALIRLRRPDRRPLDRMDDVFVRCSAGRILVVYAAFSALRRLKAAAEVEYVELARPLFPDLGEAIPLHAIDTSCHAKGNRGAGQIVGVIDDYLDVLHPDFRTERGSRILNLWDQTLDPAAVGAGWKATGAFTSVAFGVEYDRSMIDEEIASFESSKTPYTVVAHEPKDGHGTMVAGCAAGNGRAWEDYKAASGETYPASVVGAAPEADVVFVRFGTIGATEAFADSACVLEAFEYVFRRAEEHGKPCVVNLSYSDAQGAHDGTALGEEFLDSLLIEPGRAITLSAGNSNACGDHVRGTVPAGSAVALELEYAKIGSSTPCISDAIELWCEGGPLAGTLSVPTSPTVSVAIPALGGVSKSTTGGIEIAVYACDKDPRNGAYRIQVLLQVPVGACIPIGTWRFALSNGGPTDVQLDGWIDVCNEDLAQWRASAFRTEGEHRVTLGVPSTAAGPLTIGMHDDGLGVDSGIALYSGRGPTRTAAHVKPDLSAAGVAIFAAYPIQLSSMLPYPYSVESGTSFSAPIVAGACALLFERLGPKLGCNDIRSLLKGLAYVPGGYSAPDDAFGYGSLRM